MQYKPEDFTPEFIAKYTGVIEPQTVIAPHLEAATDGELYSELLKRGWFGTMETKGGYKLGHGPFAL